MNSQLPSPHRSNLSNLHTAHLPLDYLQAYPFAAFIVAQTVENSNQHRSKLEVVWSNDKISRFDVERAISRTTGYDLFAWLEDPSEGRTYTWSSGTGHLSLVKVGFPPYAKADRHHFYIITGLSSHGVSETSQGKSSRVPLNRQPSSFSSSFPSQEGTQWHLQSVAPPATSHGPVTDCLTLLETTDWSKTALGPRETWGTALTTMVDIIMSSSTPACLMIGTNFNMIYNQHYTEIVDHPVMYGQSARVKEGWGPVWNEMQGLIDRCILHGEPCYRENGLLLYRKSPSGQYLEKYHTWSFVPIRDVNNQVIGLYNPTHDTTEAVISRRRQDTLQDLAQELQFKDTVSEYFTGLTSILENNPADIPFALIYSCVDSNKDSPVQLHLESAIGVPDGHRCAPATITPQSSRVHFTGNIRAIIQKWRNDSPTPSSRSTNVSSSVSRLANSDEDDGWPVSQALFGRESVLVRDCSNLIDGIPLRIWDQLPQSAVVLPIGDGAFADLPRGVLILGLNIRSLLDAEYEEWLLSVQSFSNASLNSTWARGSEQSVQLRNEKMEKAKTAWFQGAAHDLRSPLALVAGPLDDVMRTTLTPPQRQLLGLANRNLARIQRLVTSLLDFSRLEAGQMVGHFVHVDLNAFISELAEIFRPAMERRSIAFHVELESSDPRILILIDPSLVEKAVMNLFSNALKYTVSGSVTLRIEYDTHANIVVTDTGFGIAQSEITLITDRFHRAAAAPSQDFEGSGIGLALVKEIAKLHDGELVISSRSQEDFPDSHGSTFTMRIPLEGRQGTTNGIDSVSYGVYGRQLLEEAMQWKATSDLKDDSGGQAPSVTTDESNRSEELFVFDPTDTLLLVDDNEEMRSYIKGVFSAHCTVIEASTGQQALDIARACPPQLILSDLMMPYMNGQELLELIRADTKTRLTPMVLLSAAVDDEFRLSALASGAEDFMLKPFRPRELVARVHLQMQIGKKRIQLESLYLQRQQEIALLSDYCPSGIMRADADGAVVYANSSWRRYAGMPDNEDIDQWSSYVDPDTSDRLASLWNRFVYGDDRSVIINWRYLNGTVVTGTFIRLNKVNPEMSGILGCLQDVTYQEERLLDAERRKTEAEEAKRQQELLVDVTSHEIRTPVSAILQCSSVVRDNLVTLKRELETAGPNGFRPTNTLLAELEEDLEALESIYQCGLLQERIAADVLSLTRLELDMLTIHETEIDLRKEARKVVSLFASEAKMKHIEMILEFGDLIKTPIATDHVRLGQVVTNLLANAIRFTSYSAKRVITVTYDVSFEPPGDSWPECTESVGKASVLVPSGSVWLHVAVKDTGPGLKASEQVIVFERFVQGNKMIHSKYGGSGLGLYICRKIVERLDGKIAVKSQLGEGSEFLFYISCRVPDTPSDEGVETATSNELDDLQNLDDLMRVMRPPSVEATRNSLLIVEDNLINSTVLKRQMTKAGWDCEVANDGQEALTRMKILRFDVVLMDLEMPVMDGITAVKHIREGETPGSRQLVIALTGNARRGQIDQALEAGMDEVVIKPYKLPDLVEKLTFLLRRRKDVD